MSSPKEITPGSRHPDLRRIELELAMGSMNRESRVELAGAPLNRALAAYVQQSCRHIRLSCGLSGARWQVEIVETDDPHGRFQACVRVEHRGRMQEFVDRNDDPKLAVHGALTQVFRDQVTRHATSPPPVA